MADTTSYYANACVGKAKSLDVEFASTSEDSQVSIDPEQVVTNY